MQKLNTLRKIFKHYNIEGYIVPKNDEFFGEYISDSRDRLKFISSFTGSAGYALILRKKSYLFVDGRYTLQALKESGKKFKIVEIHKTKPSDIFKKLKKKITIGYDPRLLTKSTINNLFSSSKCDLKLIQKNLVDKIWNKKNKIQIKKFYILPEKHMGESYKSKIKRTNN
jgi:Creatinase/Prolidase N-terminal domain.